MSRDRFKVFHRLDMTILRNHIQSGSLAWGLLGLLVGIGDFLRISLSSTGQIPIRFLLIMALLYTGIGGLAGLLAALLVRSIRILFRDDRDNLFAHYIALGIGFLLVIGFLSRPSQIIILRPFIRSPAIVLLIASILIIGWLLHLPIHHTYRWGPQRWFKRRRINETRFGARFTMAIFALILIVTLGHTLWTIIPSLSRNSPWRSTGRNGLLPNVIIITLDTTRRDHLSSYGYPLNTTPNIDRLARDGVIYTNAFSTSGWTLPSHSSLFTGLYPYEHGAHRFAAQSTDQRASEKFGIHPLHSDHQTLAETLSAHGYRTGAIIGGPFLSSTFGVAQGFEVYNDHFPWDDFLLRSEWIQLYPVRKFSQLMGISLRLLFPSSNQRRADHVSQYAVRWLNRGDERPFFLFLNYFDPHSPYDPPPPFNRLFETDTLGMVRPPSSLTSKMNILTGTFDYDPKFIRYQISQYDGEISYMDYYLGAVIDYLKEVKIYDNTLIIITSDHGEILGEHNRFGHGRPLFEQLLQIPLIIKFPGGVRSGEVIDESIQLVDLMAVILSSLDLPLPDNVYRPPSLALDQEAHEVISEVYPKIAARLENTSSFEDTSSASDRILTEHLDCYLTCTQRVIYIDSYKYIRASCGREELYHLDSDPGETINRVETDKEVVRQCRLRLENWLAETRTHIKVEEDFAPDPSLRAKLTALGYLQ